MKGGDLLLAEAALRALEPDIEEEHFPAPLASFASWKASLALAFSASAGTTRLVRRGQHGPLLVQRPFFPEGGKVCHAYILHPPGGIVAGDALNLEIEVEEGAHALVTAPAASKIYRSDGRVSSQMQTVRVAAGGVMEWLPPEAIFFDGARSHWKTRIELSGNAVFMGWEILCLGRPACGERFRTGFCRQHFELWRDGRPLVLERARLGPGVFEATWGLRGASISAALFATSPALTPGSAPALLQELRGLPVREGTFASASVVSDVLVFRFLGNAVESARILFEQAWRILRPVIAGRPACAPRIWST